MKILLMFKIATIFEKMFKYFGVSHLIVNFDVKC